jgi:hypothetical protein
MVPILRIFRTWGSTGLIVSISKIASIAKLSYIVGSWGTFFSLAPAVIPVGGMIGGARTSFSVFFTTLLFKGCITGAIGNLLLQFELLPSFMHSFLYVIAAHYWLQMAFLALCATLCLFNKRGFYIAGAFFIADLLFKVMTGQVLTSLHVLAYSVPGLFASLYWSAPRASIRVGIPLLCMVLFIMHPTGWYAAPYTLFWLIPLGVYLSGTVNIYAHAFACSFIAHAIGSVIWLYTVSMPAANWYAIMIRVPFERTVMALAMVAVYYAIQLTKNLLITGSIKVYSENYTSGLHNGR